MKHAIELLWKRAHIPAGARTLTAATAVRWIGWGFAESLVPIFIFSFGTGFAQAGLLRSGYEIALIIALPFIGVFADRVRASTLILIALALYLFVGTGYLLAGITGLGIFIFISRFLNGVAWGLDSTARGTYFRRSVPGDQTATVFGYFDTIATFWWVMAALVGIVLVKTVSIHWLLFLITPAALVAAGMIWRFRKQYESPIIAPHEKRKSSMVLREVFGWSGALKWMAVFNFFISGAAAVVAFYLPIEVYREGASLSAVIAMGIISTIPVLFGWGFGALFDAIGGKVFIYGLLIFSGLLFLLGGTGQYLWQVVAFFGVNLVIELLSVGSNELITVHAKPEQFGRVASVISSISMIGTLTAPLIVGIMIDSYGAASSYFTLGAILFVLALLFAILYKRGFMRSKMVVEAEVVG